MTSTFEWDDYAVVIEPQDITAVYGDFGKTVIAQLVDGQSVGVVIYGRSNLRLLIDALELRHTEMGEEP